MLCALSYSSLSIEQCHNILPCERTSADNMTRAVSQFSLLALFESILANEEKRLMMEAMTDPDTAGFTTQSGKSCRCHVAQAAKRY